MDQCLAVHVKNAFKSYGSKTVLSNFCMHVPKGVIYGLLGASGCGKTTLLNCLVGCKSLDSGKLSVLGSNLSDSAAPSSRLGFMPQDVALPAEFTVSEAVHYFGKIYGIRDRNIKETFSELSQLLDLPPDNKLIKNCSGGEQRRVSFAAALINDPELLILDEPTVGLDPILRETLWSYLLQLVKEKNTAVIITTHYIEEARQAHQVGYIRQGKLLIEDSPEKLLSFYESKTLEEVFLVLSALQSSIQNDSSIPFNGAETIGNAPVNINELAQRRRKRSKGNLHKLALNPNRLTALFIKNFVQISRNMGGTFFTFLLPVISMLLLLLAIGDDAKNIDIAIVNDENLSSFCKNYNHATSVNTVNCEARNLSCSLVQTLEDPLISKNFFDDLNNALDALNHGTVWAVLHIPSNFSEAFQKRIQNGLRVSPSILDSSQITVWVDVSNMQVGRSIKLKLREKMLQFQKTLLVSCNYSSASVDSILRLESVLFGEKNDKFTVFVIPGILLTVVFFMSVTNTVDTIITDRREGIWHRSAVAGVSSLEIILTHFVTQLLIVIIQIVELVLLTFFAYRVEYQGTLAEITTLLLIGGISGMFYGFLISVVCNNHSVANFLTTGSFYPLVLISGVLWPLEGMSKFLQYCAFALPIALPTVSLRNVIRRGWNFSHIGVLSGLGVQIIWILLLGVVCTYQLKRHR